MKVFAHIVTLLGLMTSCSNKMQYIQVTNHEHALSVSSPQKEFDKCYCLKTENYLPRQELEMVQDIKYINTVFVFPNSSDKTKNWTGEEMVYYAENLNKTGNAYLGENAKMKLPEDNETPVLEIPWRYKTLQDTSTDSGLAIYEAIDDNLYYYVTRGKNRNNSSKAVIKKYGKFQDKAINVFAMSHHPDSIASPTYNPSRVGISLGTSVKISGIRQTKLNEVWKIATLYNHEMGHSLGLRHSWYKNDGCEDTPPNPNCYTAKPTGKCKGPISNNMMDYNHSQRAVTPCQIAIATKYMHNPKSRIRPMLVKDWCNLDEMKNLIVEDSLHVDRHIDLKGNIVVQTNSTLQLSCTVNMPERSTITVHPGGKLILNKCTLRNDCGAKWNGIELIHKGKEKAILIIHEDAVIEDVLNVTNE